MPYLLALILKLKERSFGLFYYIGISTETIFYIFFQFPFGVEYMSVIRV